MGFLYKLTSPTGKSYIGISLKAMESRWSKHVEHALGKRTGALYNALRKYGPDSFTRMVLAEEENWDRLCDMEVQAIREHGTKTPNGYNMTDGGEGHVGPMTTEARANVSIAQKKRYQRQDQRDRLLEVGRIAREASHQRRLARQAVKRAKSAEYLSSPAFKQFHGNLVRSALARPEIRAKLMECARARAGNTEWRAKISATKTGQKIGPCSEQRKQRIAEARRREWADPVMRAKRLAAFAAARKKAS
jgi:group I intron endonuclease